MRCWCGSVDGCVIKRCWCGITRSVHFISEHSLLNNVEVGKKHRKQPKFKANLTIITKTITYFCSTYIT